MNTCTPTSKQLTNLKLISRYFLMFIICFMIHSETSAQRELDISKPISFQLNNEDIPRSIDMPSFEIPDLQKNDSPDKITNEPLVFAKGFEVDYNLNNSGKWNQMEEGRYWQISFRSKQAYSLNLILSKVNIPEGAAIFAYTADRKKIAGPFTAEHITEDQTLPIQPLAGDQIILEYFEPNEVSFKGEITVSKISHDYKDILKISAQRNSPDPALPCHVCVNSNLGDDWQDAKRSVSLIIFDGTLCFSGALINNVYTVNRPFLITTQHAFNNATQSGDFGSYCVFMFNYENECNGLNGLQYMVVNGAKTRSNSKAFHSYSDYRLFELNARVPSSYRAFFAGFDNSGSVPNGAAVIHHPRGAVKKLSLEYDPLISSSTFYNQDPNGFVWMSGLPNSIPGWNHGTTETGSSGAPWFDEKLRIIGTHWGGDIPACNVRNIGISTKFSVSWDVSEVNQQPMSYWLGGSVNPSVLDGVSPKGWRHEWMDESSNPIPSQIAVGNGNQVFYVNPSNQKIYTYYWDNFSSSFVQQLVSDNISSHNVAGDLVVGDDNEIFYRGANGLLQMYFYNNGWTHKTLGRPNHIMSTKAGSLAVGQNNSVVFADQNDNLKYYYKWWGMNWLPYNIPTQSVQNKFKSNLLLGKSSSIFGQIFYQGNDSKIHTVNLIGNTWAHAAIGSENLHNSNGSLAINENNDLFFRKQSTNQIHAYFRADPNPLGYPFISKRLTYRKAGGFINVSPSGQLYYRGIDGIMYVCYENGSGNWSNPHIETSTQTPNEHSIFPIGEIASGGGYVFYKGGDSKLHYYFYDGTGYKRTIPNQPGINPAVSNDNMNDIPVLADEMGISAATLFPNPASNQLTLTFSLQDAQNVTSTLVDLSGKEILSIHKNQHLEKGLQKERIDISKITKGVYFVIIQSDQNKNIQKLIIQ